MATQGGKREGAGRPYKYVTEQRRIERQQIEKLADDQCEKLEKAFRGNAHAFLRTVYRDKKQPLPVRIEAAKSAIRYETPALQAIEVTGKGGGPVQMITKDMTAREAEEAYMRMLAGK